MVERAVCVAAGRRALVVCVPRLLGSVGSDTRRPELGVGASAPASVRHAGPDLMLRRCWEATVWGAGGEPCPQGGLGLCSRLPLGGSFIHSHWLCAMWLAAVMGRPLELPV